ncbi:MAG: hypothetical protein ACAH27_18875 [Xanthobacteraceae bacterium]
MTRTALSLILVFALVVGACVACGSYFAYVGLIAAHRQVLQSRFDISMERVATAAERAASFGIALRAQTTLPTLLADEARLDPLVRGIAVRDERGETLFANAATEATGVALRRPIRNDLGKAIGEVSLVYDAAALEQGAAELRASLSGAAMAATGFGALCTLIVGAVMALLLRRALHRAADPATWPEPARRALADAEAVHAKVAHTLEGPAAGGAA